MRKILGTFTAVLAAGALGGFAIAGSADGATTSPEVAPAKVPPRLDKHYFVEHDSPWSMSASFSPDDYLREGQHAPLVQGELDHDGSGPTLAAGDKTVELTDFVVDPGASVLTGTVSVDGDVAAEGAPLFFLDGRTLNPLQVNDHGTPVLEGTTVKLKAEGADLLNQPLGIADLQEGMTIGLAKITVNTSA